MSVQCPALPGCWSQGESREEARENIKDAINDWLAVAAEEDGVEAISEELLTVKQSALVPRIQGISQQVAVRAFSTP